MRWVSALLYRNGVIEESGVAAAVLNHPAYGVAWLANKLAAHGEELKAGEIVLGGSFTSPVPARKGDTFQVDYGPAAPSPATSAEAPHGTASADRAGAGNGRGGGSSLWARLI